MESVLTVIAAIVALKAVSIGSEFSVYFWFKYGKNYTKWYFNREQFDSNKKY